MVITNIKFLKLLIEDQLNNHWWHWFNTEKNVKNFISKEAKRLKQNEPVKLVLV